MQYEIYVDTLFLFCFGMNLYLLELTNISLRHTATWGRVLSGALCGAAASVLPLFLPWELGMTGGLGFLLSAVCMTFVTFRVQKIGVYLRILEVMSVLTVVLGSLLLYLLRFLPEGGHLPAVTILLAGGAAFLLIHRLIQRRNRNDCECKVTLYSQKAKVKVNALIDTGNSLVEPISGMPVAVLDKGVFESLFFEEKPAGFRVIPYSSVDKKAGLLPGYLIPEIHVEQKGIRKVFQNIYIGVGQEMLAAPGCYKMIINPDMLKERK